MAAGAKIGMKVISIAIGIPISIATKKVVERVWFAARPGQPPRKATDADVAWPDAIGWAVLSAAGIVVADLATRRSTEVAFHKLTGNEPPPPKPSKAARKLAKASEASKVTADE